MEAVISTIIEYHAENMNRNKKYGMYFAINIYIRNYLIELFEY
ncbi:hypothetical protein [Clostridioides sp. ZZV14-6345]